MSEQVAKWVKVALAAIGFAIAGLTAFHALDTRVTMAEGQTKVIEVKILATDDKIDLMLKRFDHLELKVDRVLLEHKKHQKAGH